MPPKPKFSREDIINAAFDIVQKSGTDAMTAREVGKYLGTSSTPIFTAFNDMSELRAAVCDKARKVFDEYMAVAEDFSPAKARNAVGEIRPRKPDAFSAAIHERQRDRDRLQLRC